MKERDLFIATLQMDDPAGRAVFLAEVCGNDTEFRQRVERLLWLHDDSGSYTSGLPATAQDIDRKVRGAAYTIISGKDATYYGIGSALARIVDVILHDQRAVMTVGMVSVDVAGIRDVTLSLPRLVGGQGVLETFPPPLSQEESNRLRESARVIRQALDELGDLP
jgi:hypothetical protein